MRLQRMRLPDPMHCAVRHARGAGQIRVVQWVIPALGGFRVRATIWARLRALTVGGRPDLGRARKLATPPSAKRRRIRLTWTTV